RVAELIERANKTETLRFAIDMSFSSDEPDILKAMRNADKRMYEDKKHFYEQHPELIYRQ
ncbi:MAG: GGDEF domain-containing protein, partial [Clostridiales bacterium]|nr:GGDEF domain-containing protein [Clostridiales bacterium]